MSVDLLISDYAGHPFTVELAQALEGRGRDVAYTYCAAASSPKGSPGTSLAVVPVCTGMVFEKYHPIRRLISELRYGLALSRVVVTYRPKTHVLCNMPLVSAAVAWLSGTLVRANLVLWFQDVQSGIAAKSLGRGWMASALSWLEGFVLRRSGRIVAISPELAAEAIRRGVSPNQVGVLENWAPIERIPAMPRDTSWSREHGLGDGIRFIYSGTLARKHDPALLLELARQVEASGAEVIIVSEGEGAEWIKPQIGAGDGPSNIRVFPFQPFERLPEVLASADVLVVVLEPDAAPFSVPSKTLSYLCAARPILASIPHANAAAKLISDRAQAGLVIEPSDREAFLTGAHTLAADEHLRNTLGEAGRRYAEQHFAEEAVVEAFNAELTKLDAARR